MNKLIKIFTILLFAGIISSCAKDEVEAPSQSSEEKAIETIDYQKEVEFMEVEEVDNQNTGTPASINDDGDDEDEDRTLITEGITSSE